MEFVGYPTRQQYFVFKTFFKLCQGGSWWGWNGLLLCRGDVGCLEGGPGRGCVAMDMLEHST
jgi:hypothetical protein